MNKLKVWLLLLLVFGSGFGGGVVTARMISRRVIQVAINHPERVRERVERRLDARLGLDAGQREKLHQILMDTHENLRALRGRFQPEFQAIMRQTRTNVQATLTRLQAVKLEKFIEENRQLWQPE